MSSIIDNDDINKQWAVVEAVLYSRNLFWTFEVQDLKNNNGKNFNKRSNRFYVHTLADSKRLKTVNLCVNSIIK